MLGNPSDTWFNWQRKSTGDGWCLQMFILPGICKWSEESSLNPVRAPQRSLAILLLVNQAAASSFISTGLYHRFSADSAKVLSLPHCLPAAIDLCSFKRCRATPCMFSISFFNMWFLQFEPMKWLITSVCCIFVPSSEPSRSCWYFGVYFLRLALFCHSLPNTLELHVPQATLPLIRESLCLKSCLRTASLRIVT